MAGILIHKWLRAAVAIGTGITHKMEYVLVFVDPLGGAGKTRFINSLAPQQFVKDSIILDLQDKDSIKIATSCWIAELGELDGTFRKSDQKRIMAFLSSHVDEMRMPYGRSYNKYPRRTAFMGTVNTPEFLVDNSLNRRWWPVRVERLDHCHEVDMQQLWAQIYHEVAVQGQTWYLTDDESAMLNEHNEMFRAHSRITETLSGAIPLGGAATEHMTCTAVLKACGIHNPSKGDLNEAAAWMRSRGYRKHKRNGRLGYFIPPIQTGPVQFDVIEGSAQ
jgi:putative DNA primase/helicase